MVDSRLSNVWLVSFADSRLRKPKERLYRQAVEFGFDVRHIFICDETGLDAQFVSEMGHYLVLGSRGFGYWCWKPQICLQAMSRIPDGDILLYVDVGCHLNQRGKSRFYDYLWIAEKAGFCGFQSRSFLSFTLPDPRHHVWTNGMFCKGDILDYFGVRCNDQITRAGQMSASVFFMRKSQKAVDFLARWKKVWYDDFRLIDDSPSRSNSLPEFVFNRHDQSAYSLLWLTEGLPTVSGCEIEPLRKYAPAPTEFIHDNYWGHAWFRQMSRFPILAKRDKGMVGFGVKLFRFVRYRILPRLLGGLNL